MEVDFVMSLGYFGYIIGAIINITMGDLIGRKRLMLLNLTITLLGLVITLISLNMMMAGIGLMLVTAGVRNCFNACFYFIAEEVS
jgi:MFS transporter, AAHS family, benzoate transport protein